MKLKLYLRMVLAAMTALFVATGCNDSNNGVDDPVDVDPITFELQVTNVETGKATVAVKPSKDNVTYFCNAMEKTAFDAYTSEAELLKAELKHLETLASQNKMTLKAYLEMYGGRGEANVTVNTTVAKTAHYAYVYGIKTDGTITSKVFKTEFVSGEKQLVPVLRLTLQAGKDGANKSTQITGSVWVTESPAVSGKYFMSTTAYVDEQIAAGKTYESLVAELDERYAFAEAQLTKMNSEDGYGMWFGSQTPLSPGTSYTLIIRVLDAQGAVGVSHVEASTEPGSGGGDKPVLEVTVKPGDSKGANTDRCVFATFSVTKSPAVSGYNGVFATELVNQLLGEGKSYADIVKTPQYGGYPFEADEFADLNNGGIGWTWGTAENPLKAGTSYTAIGLVTDANGNTVETHAVASTTGGGGGGLTFTFSVTEITATAAKIRVIPSNNSDTYYFDVIESSVIAGMSDSQIITALGEAPSKYPSQGTDGYDPEAFEKYPLATGVEHTVFAFGYANGAATTPIAKYTFTPTGGGDEPTEAYKAWLGTWTVTSAKNEVDNSPVSFDVTFSQKAANLSYKVIGWGISGNRLVDQVAMTFDFDSATGGFKAMNSFVIISDFETPDKGPGTVQQLMNFFNPTDGKYYPVGGKIPALIATMNANKQSANVVGGAFNFEGDPNTYTASCLDLAIVSSENKVWRWNPAAGFTNRPVGPYTMTKKAASAPAKSLGMSPVNLKPILENSSNAVAKQAVAVASSIPQFSSMLKAASMSAPSMLKASRGQEIKLQAAAPMSVIYEAVPVE